MKFIFIFLILVCTTSKSYATSDIDMMDEAASEIQCDADPSCIPAQQEHLPVTKESKDSDCSLYIDTSSDHSENHTIADFMINDLKLNEKYDVVSDYEGAKYSMTILLEGKKDELSKVKASLIVYDYNQDIYEMATGMSGYIKKSAASSLSNAYEDLEGCKKRN